MSLSATRLTCYVLIAAIEEDMRAAIEAYLGDLTLSDALPMERVQRAQERRHLDGLSESPALPGLLPYLDFSDSYELLMSHKSTLPDDLREALQSIGPQVARLIAIRNRVAHTRPMEIDDSVHMLDISDLLKNSDGDHWVTLSNTIDRLHRDPSYVLGLTVRLPADRDTAPQHNLPVPEFDETGFFGRKDQLRRIKKAIKGAYPVVSILGDGGIGKTAIALKAAYELLEDPEQPFEAFVWVTAKATILTINEIQRISGAIESSLGLFVQAASELGAPDVEDPVAEVLAYLENFKILLVLDNLETVLDARLRNFLLDLPLGSKVIITSRIGVGIENPVQLGPLTSDDSTRLLRALARTRDVAQLQRLSQDTVQRLARKMGGNPTYIRWFVAGIQSGKRPEELVENNELLLDFCMSNVYRYLGEDARAVVRCMQVLPGTRNQAELAFLNDFPSGRIQAALLELLTTNFVLMSSQSLGQTLDTVYHLSEFAKQYLDKHHPVAPDERDWLMARNRQLTDLGSQLTAASVATPYSADTVNVRGLGDVHVARLLREAMRCAGRDPGAALGLCAEAQGLAPGYYEAWRIEAHVRSLMQDRAAAVAAYERALELAPDSPVLLYHYGSFLLNEAGDPHRGLELLQAGARLDPDSPGVAGQISWAHYCLGDMLASIDSARHVLAMRSAGQHEARAAGVVILRAACNGVQECLDISAYGEAAEMLELSVEFAETASVEMLIDETYDRLIYLRSLAEELADSADGYPAQMAKEFQSRLAECQRRTDPSNLSRSIGVLKALKTEKGFGFVTAYGVDYFFHYRDLIGSHEWESLAEGVSCAFESMSSPRGPRAGRVRVLE